MVRPSNISIEAHTADFSCGQCKKYESGVDLNTKTEYGKNPSGETDTTRIVVVCSSVISGGCSSVSVFPTDDQHNILGYQLGRAKSA